MQVSTDHGQTFAGTQTAPEDDRPWLTAAGHTCSDPIQVDHDAGGAGTHVLPHLAVTAPGNVDVVWYGTTATGEPNGVCGTIPFQSPCKDGFPDYTDPNAPAWNVYLAQSTDALSATPVFRQAVANSKATHTGGSARTRLRRQHQAAGGGRPDVRAR